MIAILTKSIPLASFYTPRKKSENRFSDVSNDGIIMHFIKIRTVK